jgi:hypothetical protein
LRDQGVAVTAEQKVLLAITNIFLCPHDAGYFLEVLEKAKHELVLKINKDLMQRLSREGTREGFKAEYENMLDWPVPTRNDKDQSETT